MGLLFALEVAAQIALAVHAVRTGRSPIWLWLIVCVPVAGCAAYVLAELLPDLWRGAGRSRGPARPAASRRDVRRLEEQLEVADTIANRVALAEALRSVGRASEAVALYRRCLQGAYSADLALLDGLAKALFADSQHQEALAVVQRLLDANPQHPDRRHDLLRARSLEALGRTAEALTAYDNLVGVAVGEEVRCRYAMLLLTAGQPAQARALLLEVLRNARLSPGYYRRAQREWVRLARRHLREVR